MYNKGAQQVGRWQMGCVPNLIVDVDIVFVPSFAPSIENSLSH